VTGGIGSASAPSYGDRKQTADLESEDNKLRILRVYDQSAERRRKGWGEAPCVRAGINPRGGTRALFRKMTVLQLLPARIAISDDL